MINDDNEVERLTRELQSLSLRSLQISRRLSELTSNEYNSDEDSPLRVGDLVRVTTNYRNRRGTVGTITRTTNATVWIRTHNGNRNLRLRIGSVERVTATEDLTPVQGNSEHQDVVQYEQ